MAFAVWQFGCCAAIAMLFFFFFFSVFLFVANCWCYYLGPHYMCWIQQIFLRLLAIVHGAVRICDNLICTAYWNDVDIFGDGMENVPISLKVIAFNMQQQQKTTKQNKKKTKERHTNTEPPPKPIRRATRIHLRCVCVCYFFPFLAVVNTFQILLYFKRNPWAEHEANTSNISYNQTLETRRLKKINGTKQKHRYGKKEGERERGKTECEYYYHHNFKC